MTCNELGVDSSPCSINRMRIDGAALYQALRQLPRRAEGKVNSAELGDAYSLANSPSRVASRLHLPASLHCVWTLRCWPSAPLPHCKLTD